MVGCGECDTETRGACTAAPPEGVCAPVMSARPQQVLRADSTQCQEIGRAHV